MESRDDMRFNEVLDVGLGVVRVFCVALMVTQRNPNRVRFRREEESSIVAFGIRGDRVKVGNCTPNLEYSVPKMEQQCPLPNNILLKFGTFQDMRRLSKLPSAGKCKN